MAASYEIPTVGKMLTVKQYADALALSERTVRNQIFQKRLRFFKIGGAVRIAESTLLQILARGHRKE
jgi:excisionase family DNA binding protein